MSREIVVLWAGRHRRREWEELCRRYRRRIARWRPIRDLPVKVRRGTPRERRRHEAQAMIAALPPHSWPIALDPGGDALSSEQMARELARLELEWPHPIAFLIGSDSGLGDTVLSQARQRLSLGPMTLSHELARLVLYEQIYRALSINAGINYHRAPLERR